MRNAGTLVRGRLVDSLPTSPVERRAMAAIMEYPPGDTGRLVDDYLRLTRRAHAVVERVFWG